METCNTRPAHDRRSFLVVGAAGLAALASPAWAAAPPLPALAAYERTSGGRIGVHALNVRTGAELSWRQDERFVMCSTFKLSLAAAVLARVDRGEERLDGELAYGPADMLETAPVTEAHLAQGRLSVAALCEAAVTVSDNTAANLLLARIGGPQALTRFWRQACADGISRLDHNEPMLNRSPPGDPQDTTTPRAMAETVRRLILGDVLKPASRDRLSTWMQDCRTGANRLRGGLPTDWRIGDKTGNNGRDAAGDLAVAWPAPDGPLVIATYVQGGHPTPDDIQAVFAAVGRAAAGLA